MTTHHRPRRVVAWLAVAVALATLTPELLVIAWASHQNAVGLTRSAERWLLLSGMIAAVSLVSGLWPLFAS